MVARITDYENGKKSVEDLKANLNALVGEDWVSSFIIDNKYGNIVEFDGFGD